MHVSLLLIHSFSSCASPQWIGGGAPYFKKIVDGPVDFCLKAEKDVSALVFSRIDKSTVKVTCGTDQNKVYNSFGAFKGIKTDCQFEVSVPSKSKLSYSYAVFPEQCKEVSISNEKKVEWEAKNSFSSKHFQISAERCFFLAAPANINIEVDAEHMNVNSSLSLNTADGKSTIIPLNQESKIAMHMNNPGILHWKPAENEFGELDIEAKAKDYSDMNVVDFTLSDNQYSMIAASKKKDDDDDSLSPGAVIGIILAICVVLGCVAFYFFRVKRVPLRHDKDFFEVETLSKSEIPDYSLIP